MRMKSMAAATLCVAALGCATGGVALAGESTGNFEQTGKTTPVADYVMHSICAFSGQNPEVFLDPSDPNFEPGHTQSWGQIPKEVRDVLATQGEHPGDSCNGHTGFLAGGGEE